MTTARNKIVDVNRTRWYHCISRCVRAAFLIGQGECDRKQWVEDRLKMLCEAFAISVGGFAILDNHLHVLCRLDPDVAKDWSAEDVVRRWCLVYSPRTLDRDNPKLFEQWVKTQAKDAAFVQKLRRRLCDLGWFMKSLKEPLARMANRADGCRGTFWEARYRSIAILDEEALLATCAYIDLNPLAAGIAATPETSKHTSVRQRVNHVRSQGELDRLKSAQQGSVAASRAAGNIEQKHWLVPIEDRREHTNAKTKSLREGMLETFSLGSYLLLLDYTGRLCRNGKARMSSAMKGVFDRLDSSCDRLAGMVVTMLERGGIRGHFLASNPETPQSLPRPGT